MTKMKINGRTCRLTTALVGIVLGLAVVPTTRAEDQPVVYTRVAQWQIARPQWGAYEKDLKKNMVPVMEKLLADGVITEFGADRTTVHSPDGYTHSTWFCAKSLAGLEKALDTLVESESKLTPEERRKQDTDFAGTKHADLILRSVWFKNRTVKTEKGYGTVSVQKMQPGKAQEYQDLFDKYTKPVLEQLYKDGAVTAYGVDAELVHTGDQGLRFFWQVMPDADALDKVEAAFDAARQKRTPEERRAIGQAFADLRDPAAHRDSQANIVYYSAK
jgi:competence protein ComGC